MKTIETFKQELQVKNYNKACETIAAHPLNALGEGFFDELKPVEAETFAKVHGRNSKECLYRKAIGEVARVRGINVNDVKFEDFVVEYPTIASVATLCATKSSKQQYAETAAKKLLLKNGFIKDEVYVTAKGTFAKSMDEDRIIKSIDFINHGKKIMVYCKHWNGEGGSQESDSNEITTLLKRSNKSDHSLWLFCTGSYFDIKVCNHINKMIAKHCPNAVLITNLDDLESQLQDINEVILSA